MDLFTPDRARKRLHSFNISENALRSANRRYILYMIFSFLLLFFFFLQLFIRALFQVHIV